eukprot:TRINITY_DN4227_c0_g2_i1.p1 TRINITY_DN4227_c0_g2~~TRINITY_DN4227_c0_g2_i1.p1  ORF type:complete len:260 (-),score=70.77 TRINITY_DN4227_c0_g2_i1:54-833(-)
MSKNTGAAVTEAEVAELERLVEESKLKTETVRRNHDIVEEELKKLQNKLDREKENRKMVRKEKKQLQRAIESIVASQSKNESHIATLQDVLQHLHGANDRLKADVGLRCQAQNKKRDHVELRVQILSRRLDDEQRLRLRLEEAKVRLEGELKHASLRLDVEVRARISFDTKMMAGIEALRSEAEQSRVEALVTGVVSPDSVEQRAEADFYCSYAASQFMPSSSLPSSSIMRSARRTKRSATGALVMVSPTVGKKKTDEP